LNQQLNPTILQHVREAELKKWVEMETEYRWFIHHDDARMHAVPSAHMFLAKNNIHLFHSQPATPALSQQFFFFLLEINLKYRRF